MNVREKNGGHKIVTSTSTYVHMSRFPWYLSGEIVYPEVNVHRDVSFQRPFFYEKTEIVGKSRGFRVVGGDETQRFFLHVFSCMYDLHVFYRANRVLHTWIEGPFCVETSEL